MSTLDSTSTLADIKAAYADNASYAEDGSTAKAKAFVTACRLLLIKIPKRTAKDNSELEMDTKLIREEMDSANQWLAANGGTGGPSVKYADTSNFRS